jgi:hypothetical protein
VTLRSMQGDDASSDETRVIRSTTASGTRFESVASVAATAPRLASVAMFVSRSPIGTPSLADSLLEEVEQIQLVPGVQPLSGMCPVVPANLSAVVSHLRHLSSARIDNLVLLFCGHGEHDGIVCGDGTVARVETLAKWVARCKPACVIYNVCNGGPLAAKTRSLARASGCGIVFWSGPASTKTCCVLSVELLRQATRVAFAVEALAEAFEAAYDVVGAQHNLSGLHFLGCDDTSPADGIDSAVTVATAVPLAVAHANDTVGIQQLTPIEFGICEPDGESENPVRGHFSSTAQVPPHPGAFAVHSAERFLTDFINNVCALYVVGKYFDSPVPSREFWYQVSREYYTWLTSAVGTQRPHGLARPAVFDVRSTVPYVVVHVHFLAKADQPDQPDFDRVGSVNLRWSKGVDDRHLQGVDPAHKLSKDQLLFLGSWSGCLRTGRLNNPYALPTQPGAMPRLFTKDDDGGGGLNVTGRHSLVRDPPGTLGHGWRQIDVVEFSTEDFSECDGRLLRAFEKVYDLPEGTCCFDDVPVVFVIFPTRFRVKVDWATFPAGSSPRYTRRVWRNPTALDTAPNDVVDPPYFKDVRRFVRYEALRLGWEYKNDAQPTPLFGAPLPDHGHLGARVDPAVVPDGLRGLLRHAEAERARLARDRRPLDYATFKKSRGKWEGDRFVPATESCGRWDNRGAPTSADAASADSAAAAGL